jgi:hypothetical protein
MSKVIVDTGVSLDGFVVGPNIGPHNALGDGGTLIHQWLFSLETWRERQSLADGETNPDDEVVKEAYARVGAYMMERRMFDEGEVNRRRLTVAVGSADAQGLPGRAHSVGRNLDRNSPRRAGHVRVATGGGRDDRAGPEVYDRRGGLARGGRPDLPADRLDERPAHRVRAGSVQAVGSTS